MNKERAPTGLSLSSSILYHTAGTERYVRWVISEPGGVDYICVGKAKKDTTTTTTPTTKSTERKEPQKQSFNRSSVLRLSTVVGHVDDARTGEMQPRLQTGST